MTALMEPLFAVTAGKTGMGTDEWYTPRWLFKAAGLTFDLDVCAPADSELRTCPAVRYLTVAEDGLTSEWSGLVWCNPPYSRPAPWVERWAVHPDGLILLTARQQCRWVGRVMQTADAMTIICADFSRPDGTVVDLQWALFLAARGQRATEALTRVAAADRYGAGAYLVRPAG